MDEKLHSYTSGAWLPALQSIISGVFGVLVVGGLLWLSGAKQAGPWLLLGGAAISAITWMVLLRRWLSWVERLHGYTPAPRVTIIDDTPALPAQVRVNLTSNNNDGYIEGQFVDLPCKPEQLRMFANSVIQGGSLGENAWSGADRPFSKSQFHALRQELINRGWLCWRSPGSPSQGIQPTAAGKRVFSYLADGKSLSTLPHQESDEW